MDVVVGNAGVDGQSSVGHIKNFDWWFPDVPGLEPKYVLLYVGLNDFYVREGSRYDNLLRSEDPTFRGRLREHSAIYGLVRTLHGMYLAMVGHGIGHEAVNYDSVEWTREPLQRSHVRLMGERLADYKARLDILISRIEAFGSSPILVVQPERRYRFTDGVVEGISRQSLYQGVPINGVDQYRMMIALNEITLSTCEERGGLCVDLSTPTLWEDGDFYDYSHMTPAGAEKVGQYLFEELRQHLEVPPHDASHEPP